MGLPSSAPWRACISRLHPQNHGTDTCPFPFSFLPHGPNTYHRHASASKITVANVSSIDVANAVLLLDDSTMTLSDNSALTVTADRKLPNG